MRAAKLRDVQTEYSHITRPITPKTDWAELVPVEEWDVYATAIELVRAAGVNFMIGGAFGLACYTGRWRNTKDVDFYILPEDRERAVEALTRAGFRDYYDEMEYDRRWIYRAIKGGYLVDLIWAMANQRAQVQSDWFDYALPVTLHGQELQTVPAEELLWCKLYVFQRDRCDWPDIINLIHAVGPQLDWPRLAARVGDDACLLDAVVSIVKWLVPSKAAELPANVEELVECRVIEHRRDDLERRRVQLLDSRPWFAAHQPADKPLNL